MRLVAALTGDLAKILEAERKAGEVAVTAAVRTAGTGLKLELRRQVVSAGLGERLANAWQQSNYPAGGASLGAAALVRSKAPTIFAAFNAGAVIRRNGGRWLAIPTANVPRMPGARGGGKRMSPVDVEAHFNAELRFVEPRGGKRSALLVLDQVTLSISRKTGKVRGVRRATKGRPARGKVSVVMFVLVPQVRLRKRLDVEAAGQRWLDRLPSMILEAWQGAQQR